MMLGFIQIPVALLYLKIEKQHISKTISRVIARPNGYAYPVIGSFFNIVGTGFLWLSFYFTLASIASPITATNGALTVLFALFVIKDKVSLRAKLGIAITFIAVAVISLLSA
jgi:drug/metabolite transporter (DMT)-like permease